MTMEQLTRIIDDIYTAAVDSSAWPAAVGGLQSYFDCASAGIYTADIRSGTAKIVHVHGITPHYIDSYVDHYLRESPFARIPEFQVPGKIRTDRSLDEHYNKPGYYRTTSFFNEWLNPQGFTYSMSTNLTGQYGWNVKFYLYRSKAAGPFSSHDECTLSRLAGHLGNAVKAAQRLAQREARGAQALQVTDLLRFGVVFLDEVGLVLEANRVAEELFRRRDGIACEDGAVVAAHRADCGALAELVRRGLAVARARALETPGDIHLRRCGGRRPLRVSILPLPHTLDNPFAVRRPAAALLVTDPELEQGLPMEETRHRYRLTAAEARLAHLLARGITLREAADSAGVSYETARSYLKTIFQKTGTTKQSGLVRLLLSERPLVGAAART